MYYEHDGRFFDSLREYSASPHMIWTDYLSGKNSIRQSEPTLRMAADAPISYFNGHESITLQPGDLGFFLGVSDMVVRVDSINQRAAGLCVTISPSRLNWLFNERRWKDDLREPWDALRRSQAVFCSPANSNHLNKSLQRFKDSEFREALRAKRPEDLYEEIIEHVCVWLEERLKYVAGLQSKRLETRVRLSNRIERGRQHIIDNLARNLTLEEIAAAACLSPFHFSRSFEAVYAVAPLQYHAQERLGRAANQLEGTERKISDIANELGYCDLPTFSKAFKRQFNMSPRAYRKEKPNRFTVNRLGVLEQAG